MTLIRKSLPLLPIDGRELLCTVRESSTDELTLAESYISAAQNALWTIAQRAAHVTEYELTLPCFPSNGSWDKTHSVPFTDVSFVGSEQVGIELRAVPFLKLHSIKYIDVDGDEQTLAPSQYVVLDGGSDSPATVYLLDDNQWPATKARINAVTILFAAGEVNQVTEEDDVLTTVSGYEYEDDELVTISHSGNTNEVCGDVLTELSTTDFGTYYVVNASGSTFQIATTSGGTPLSLGASTNGTIYAGTLSPLVKRTLTSLAADFWLNRCPEEDCNCVSGDAGKLASRLNLLKWNYAYGD